MSAPTASAGWPSRLKSALGPRGGLAVLVAVHVLLIIGLSHSKLEDVFHRLPSSWQWPFAAFLHGIHFAQVGLIAAMAVLWTGRWFLRWPRSVMLVVWLVIAQIAGSWLLAGNRDGMLLEELLVVTGSQFLLFLVPVVMFSFISRRRFRLPQAASPPRFQFRVVHLLLLTCEVAVLLALVRAMVPYNRHWSAEVLASLKSLPQPVEFAFYAVAILATVPAIIAAAWPGRVLRNLFFLITYELALVSVISLLHITGLRWLPIPWPELPHIAVLLWESMSAAIPLCVSAVTTVWLTVRAARWLGYEFLPLPRRAGGRQSSEATSAA